MNTRTKWAMALALLSGATFGQVPATNDTSDQYNNTGMGTGALHNVTPSGNCNGTLDGGCNTAAGYEALYWNTTGAANTAVGFQALFQSSTGTNNTAVGAQALTQNSGSNNTGVGSGTLSFNTGQNNTATGNLALYDNAGGNNNTASGNQSLSNNTTGNNNTAVGYQAMGGNVGIDAIGSNNTAIGVGALALYTSGSSNSASGQNAMFSNTTGAFNTATGSAALYYNVTGSNNTADGEGALYAATGGNNTAVGQNALRQLSTGTGNIALGFQAGTSVTTGSNNIEIGNGGASTDQNVIKIGAEGVQAKTFIAGIFNTSVSGNAVMVNSSGQLGVVLSSERFKTAITSMGSDTAKLRHLRPVTFKYKDDPQGTLRYGLIAEEVAKVYPELVVRDQNGRIDSVRYDELAPMLLNEMQKQELKIDTQVRINADQAAEIRDLKRQVAELVGLKQEMRAALLKLKNTDQLVARR
jgi:hypothetical protein